MLSPLDQKERDSADKKSFLSTIKGLGSSRQSDTEPTHQAAILEPSLESYSEENLYRGFVEDSSEKADVRLVLPPDGVAQGALVSLSMSTEIEAGLAKLLSDLGRRNSLNKRIDAAKRLQRFVEEHAITDILAVCLAVKDLLDGLDSPTAVRTAYGLIAACLKYSKPTTLEKTTCFNIISLRTNEEIFDDSFEVLCLLSGNGGSANMFGSALADFIIELLNVTFISACNARRKDGGRGSKRELKSSEESNFLRIFEYIKNTIRFSAQIFGEEQLTSLINQLVAICTKTNTPTDIENSIKAIELLITCAYIPSPALRPCLETLCNIHLQLNPFRNSSWSTISKLMKSYLGSSAVLELTDMLKGTKKGNDLKEVLAALLVVEKLLSSKSADNFPHVPISAVASALSRALSSDHSHLTLEILRFLAAILGDQQLLTSFDEEEDGWFPLVLLIQDCLAALLNDGAQHNSSLVFYRLPFRGATDDKAAKTINLIVPHLISIGHLLSSYLDNFDSPQLSVMLSILISLSNLLDDGCINKILRTCDDGILLHALEEQYITCASALAENILNDSSRSLGPKLNLLHFFSKEHAVIGLFDDNKHDNLVEIIVSCVHIRAHPDLLSGLLRFTVVMSITCNDRLFAYIMEIFQSSLVGYKTDAAKKSLHHLDTQVQDDDNDVDTYANKNSIKIVQALVCMFIHLMRSKSIRARNLYEALITVATTDHNIQNARIFAFECLFRIRADCGHGISLAADSERDGQKVLLKRYDSESTDILKVSTSERFNLRDTYDIADSERMTGPTHKCFLAKKDSTLWEGNSSSQSSLKVSSSSGQGIADDNSMIIRIDVKKWLRVVIDTLRDAGDTQLFSTVVGHLPIQISNWALFTNCASEMKLLRVLVIDLLKQPAASEVTSTSNLNRSDRSVNLYQVLTVLLSYQSHFEREEIDGMARAFFAGIGTNDRVSKACIHAFHICCLETPSSASKLMESVLQRMSKIITQSLVAVDILEFLAAVVRLPGLYKNFTEEDYTTVFGICFRYLQYVRDRREKEASKQTIRPRPAGQNTTDRLEFAPAPSQTRLQTYLSTDDGLPEYVYSLAFHVITFWFMALRMQERAKYLPWIVKNISQADESGCHILEEQAQVTVDLMQRVCYIDRDETRQCAEFDEDKDGPIAKKTWVVGLGLITIETAGRTGISNIVWRRPSTTRYATYSPQFSSPPRHQEMMGTTSGPDLLHAPTAVHILPDDILQEFYSPIGIWSPGSGSRSSGSGSVSDGPVPIDDDDLTTRAISGLDRIPTVDGHKVGVIYVGPGQHEEVEILRNVAGSAEYTSFISELGTLTKLKDAPLNVQGLDTRYNSDGEFTVCWRDRVIELVFHVTTMMPTNVEEDARCTNKKRHIGNDHVNIVYNDSGLPFRYDTFPSAFNYVYIVVAPASASSPASRATGDSSVPHGGNLFTVQVLSRDGFPNITAAASVKLVSAQSLPIFVRQLALNASVFSLVSANREGGEHISSWRSRLREIKRLKDRFSNQPRRSASYVATQPLAGFQPQGPASSSTTRDSLSDYRRTSSNVFSSTVATARSSLRSHFTDPERVDGG